MAERKIGKGLTEKRARLVRLVESHAQFLALMATITPWTPPPRADRPRRPNETWPYRAEIAYAWRDWPRTKAPGAEALSEETVTEWVAGDPFVRGGLRPATQRALAYIETFRPRRQYHRQ